MRTDRNWEVPNVKAATGEPSRAAGAGASAPMSPAPSAVGSLPLATDPWAVGLVTDTVREELRAQGRRVPRTDAIAFSRFALESMAEGIAKAVLRALDQYTANAEQETDPVRPAPTAGEGAR